MGNPKVCIVAFKSDKFNIYGLGDEMKKKGWLLSAMQYPTCIHLYITPMHTQKGIKEKFVNDLSQVVEDLLQNTSKPLDGRVSKNYAVIKPCVIPLPYFGFYNLALCTSAPCILTLLRIGVFNFTISIFQ